MENNHLLSDNYIDILDGFENKTKESKLKYINEKVEKNTKKINADRNMSDDSKRKEIHDLEDWANKEREKADKGLKSGAEAAYNNFYRRTNVKPQKVVFDTTIQKFHNHVLWYNIHLLSKAGLVNCGKAISAVFRDQKKTPFFKRFKSVRLHSNFWWNFMFSIVFGLLIMWPASSYKESKKNILALKAAGVQDYTVSSETLVIICPECNSDASDNTIITAEINYYRDTTKRVTLYDKNIKLTDLIRKTEIAKLIKQKQLNEEYSDRILAIIFFVIFSIFYFLFNLPFFVQLYSALQESWPDKVEKTQPFNKKYTLKQVKTLIFPERESFGTASCTVNFPDLTKEAKENLIKVFDSGLETHMICHENSFDIVEFPELKMQYDEQATAPAPILYAKDGNYIIIYSGIHELPKMDKESISKSILSKLPNNLHELARELEEQKTMKGATQLKQLHTAFNGLTSMLGSKFDIEEKAYRSYLTTAKDLYEGGLDNLTNVKALLQTSSVIEESEITDSMNTLEKSEGRTVKAEMEELKKRRKLRENTAKMIEDLLVENEQIINAILETTFSLSQIRHSDDKSGDMIKEAMELMKEKASKSSELIAKPLNNN